MPPGDQSHTGIFQGLRKDMHLRRMDFQAHISALYHLTCMAQQAETCYIRAGMDRKSLHDARQLFH